jgi:hypothetical protein
MSRQCTGFSSVGKTALLGLPQPIDSATSPALDFALGKQVFVEH